MEVAILDMPPQVCTPFDVGAIGSFVGQSSTVQTILVQSDEELVRKLVLMLDNQLLSALETRSALEFVDARNKVWASYIRARRALSDTMTNLVPESEMDAVAKAAIATAVADVEKQRGVRFGDMLTDQAVFTLWTFEKKKNLARQIQNAGEPRDKDADLKLNQEFHLYSLWAQFHMDTVIAAMKFKRAIPEDIQAVICDGLRSNVNAYAILKEALSLRTPPVVATPVDELPWDEEDEQLLNASMRDLNGTADSL
ncbi:MAG: hypothetical protein WBV60_14720 [Terriglobales bacterium]